jgi:MFS family permease
MPTIDTNGRILLIAKAIRNFAFGLGSVAFGLHLASLGLEGPSVGLVLTAALGGQLAFAVGVLSFAHRIGRRRVLVFGSGLMSAATLIPLVGDNSLLLVLIALSGMIVVASNEPLGMQSVEHAMLPDIAAASRQTATFSWYNVISFASAALGSLFVGVVAGTSVTNGSPFLGSAFLIYAAAGVAAAFLLACLDPGMEGPRDSISFRARLIPSRPMAQFITLNAIDAFGTGLVLHAFIAFWFATKFGLDPGTIGLLFAASNLLSSASFPMAAWLAARIGLIRTMVFTHLPAGILLIAMGLVPHSGTATFLYLLRSGLSSMDMPARQSYAMAVVAPALRVSVASMIGLVRTGAMALGPGISGVFLVPLGVSVPLVVGGAVMIAYDGALFALFRRRPAWIDPGVHGGHNNLPTGGSNHPADGR